MNLCEFVQCSVYSRAIAGRQLVSTDDSDEGCAVGTLPIHKEFSTEEPVMASHTPPLKKAERETKGDAITHPRLGWVMC